MMPRSSQSPLPWKRRILDMQRRVGVSAVGASASLHEAFLEVLRQEGVQHWIHGRIGIGQTSCQQHDCHHDIVLVVSGWGEDQGQLGDPIR